MRQKLQCFCAEYHVRAVVEIDDCGRNWSILLGLKGDIKTLQEDFHTFEDGLVAAKAAVKAACNKNLRTGKGLNE